MRRPASGSRWLSGRTALVPWLGSRYLHFFGRFARDDCADEPHVTQSAESIDSIVAQNFVLKDGGITAYASNGSLVGVSNPVATENGWLPFLLHDKDVTIAPAEVYCELVSSELDGPHVKA